VEALALGLDVAPTVLALGGAPAPGDVHGRSLLPLLRGERVAWRDDFLVEHASDRVFPRMAGLGYQAVRTPRWKYIRYRELQGMDELYDLEADPGELHNRIHEPAAKAALADLKARLDRLLAGTR
jgi:arylsulfatase A-like enzyme